MRTAHLLDRVGGETGVWPRALLYGLAGGLLYWCADALFDALVLKDEFLDHVLRPTVPELAMRVSFAAALLVFSLLLLRGRRLATRLSVFHHAIEESADGVQLADLEGRVLYSNPAVETIYGFPPQHFLGRHVDEMNADPTLATRVILPSLRETGRWAGELEVKHRDGHVFPIWLVASVVRGESGPVAMVGAIRDMSERRRAEQELRQYARELEEANRLKELFADIMRHDLVNPAAAARTAAESLLRHEEDPIKRRLLETIKRASARVIDMVDNAARYAHLSRLEQVEFEDVDLDALWRTALKDLEHEAAARAQTVAYGRVGPCPAHASRMIGEVFANLLSNAIKYGPEGGRIDIDLHDEGDAWVTAVADRGEGIGDADKERIFSRFERVQREGVKGTGLGLAIARRIVELHGGTIRAEDNPGGGALFCVRLPKAPSAPPATRA